MAPEISPYRSEVSNPSEESDRESQDKKQKAAEDIYNLLLEFSGFEHKEGVKYQIFYLSLDKF
jgi:hypothetical protein